MRRWRRTWSTLLASALLAGSAIAALAADMLPSWNEGPAKAAILDFVADTTTSGSPDFVPVAERVATFDQDGTLWVEQPVYTQLLYCLDRLAKLAAANPALAGTEPYKTALSRDPEKIKALVEHDWRKILAITLTGMDIETLAAEATEWLKTARNPRWDRPYTDLVYQPMLELLGYLRANGYRTYIVTGGGQDFVRTYADPVYGIPVEQVVGTSFETRFDYDADGTARLMIEPKLFFDDDFDGKARGIALFTGRRPFFAAGNSTGDREMLEYTTAGKGHRLGMLVLHDDATREYAYGPAEGLPATGIGTFTQGLYDEATARGWTVIRMSRDWNRIFPFE